MNAALDQHCPGQPICATAAPRRAEHTEWRRSSCSCNNAMQCNGAKEKKNCLERSVNLRNPVSLQSAVISTLLFFYFFLFFVVVSVGCCVAVGIMPLYYGKWKILSENILSSLTKNCTEGLLIRSGPRLQKLHSMKTFHSSNPFPLVRDTVWMYKVLGLLLTSISKCLQPCQIPMTYR